MRILVIQPDPGQGRLLRTALQDLRNTDVIVVGSKAEALESIERAIPDVILVAPLLAAGDDDHLLAYLRVLPGAGHVQVIAIPQLQPPIEPIRPWYRGFAGMAVRASAAPLTTGCDPRLFVDDVEEYLARARAAKEDLACRVPTGAERRVFRRWTPADVPWIRSVQLWAREQARLVNISSGGALFRTDSRPDRFALERHGALCTDRPDLRLQLASGEQIMVPGRVVRCQVRPAAGGTGLYEVGFQFDQLVDALLPVSEQEETAADDSSLEPQYGCAPLQLAVLKQW